MEAHLHLERMLAAPVPPPGPGEPAYHWHHVLGALHAVCAEPSPESVEVLRRVAVFEGRYRLDEEAGLPHAMSPEDLLRSLAVQTLAQWDRERHRDVIARAAELSDSEHVAAIARSALGG